MAGVDVMNRLANFVAGLASTEVMRHSDDRHWAIGLPCPETRGLALVTLSLRDQFAQNGYIDVQTRRYVGELTDSSSVVTAMIENYRYPDAPLGICQTDRALILVITDHYRLLLNWGDEEMFEALKIRIGGMLSTQIQLTGIGALQKSDAKYVLGSLGFIR